MNFSHIARAIEVALKPTYEQLLLERNSLTVKFDSLLAEKNALAEELKQTTDDLSRRCYDLAIEKEALARELNDKMEELKEKTAGFVFEKEALACELKERTEELDRVMRRRDIGLGGNQVESTPVGEAEAAFGSPRTSLISGRSAPEESDARRKVLQQELFQKARACWAQFIEVVRELEFEREELSSKIQALLDEQEELKDELEHLRKETKVVWRELKSFRDREGELEEQLEEIRNRPSRSTPMRSGLPNRELRLEKMLAEVRRSIAERVGWLGVDSEEPGDDCWQEASPQAQELLASLEEKAAASEVLHAESDRIAERSRALQVQEPEVYRVLSEMAGLLGQNQTVSTTFGLLGKN